MDLYIHSPIRLGTLPFYLNSIQMDGYAELITEKVEEGSKRLTT
jgi:hypothetical protein